MLFPWGGHVQCVLLRGFRCAHLQAARLSSGDIAAVGRDPVLVLDAVAVKQCGQRLTLWGSHVARSSTGLEFGTGGACDGA